MISTNQALHNEITRVTAVLAQSLSTVDNGLLGPGTANVTYHAFADELCPSIDPDRGIPFSACASGDELYIGGRSGGPHNSFFKYVIGHEFGHSVQFQTDANVPREGYPDSIDAEVDGIPLCSCVHVTSANKRHCLQSREGFGDAITEGYGHFYAAKLFNDPTQNDCTFVYYKEFLPPGATDAVPPASPENVHSCREQVRWMESHCAGSNRGTEFDWMNFLFDINTASGGQASTMLDISAIMDGAASSTYPEVEGSAGAHYGNSTDPRLIRFVDSADVYGVNF